LKHHKAIDQRLRGRALVSRELIPERRQRRICGIGLVETIDEVEARPGDSEECLLLSVAPGESIGHDIGAARLVLNREVEAEELADPMMLRDGRQALI